MWTDDPNKYKDVRIIFQDFETSNWTWDPVAQQYYWHRFFHHQPDLNYDNPTVQQEVFKLIDYWCNMGVDGFRLDAVPYLYEREGTNGENLPETHDFLKKLRKHIDEHFPGTVFLAEANMWPEDSASYFGDGDECHMNYHFPVMPRMFMALQREDRYPITDIFDQTPPIPETCQWAMFLRNHDELTLEMVTDEERDYMYKVYAKDPKARINLGIRHRLAPLMENNRRKIELMNSLLFSMPGTPVIYYGDEIGMGDNFYLGDRDGVRTPMQWSPDRNGGFSSTNPQKLYLPVILDPEYNYEAVNVETQRRNTSSLFWFMKRLISMRKKYKAFGRGDMKFINIENPKVLAFTRTYEKETLLIVVNLSRYAQAAEINLEEFKGYAPMEVFSKNNFPFIKESTPYFFTLAPHSFQWYALKKVETLQSVPSDQSEIILNDWKEISGSKVKELLESEILPEYLSHVKWIRLRGRKIFSCSIVRSVIPKGMKNTAMLFIETSFDSGLPETYHLTVSFNEKKKAIDLRHNHPQSLVACCRLGDNEGYIADAFYTSEFHKAVINEFRKDITKTEGRLVHFTIKNEAKAYFTENNEFQSKVHAVNPNYTSINYNNEYLLKLYRRMEKVINPDYEITLYLSDKVHFEHTPAFMGNIEWVDENEYFVLGMMQKMVENHGDGHIYMLERINNYIERIMARDRPSLKPKERIGSFTDPVPFEHFPEHLQLLIGNNAAEQARLTGKRTAELHLELAKNTIDNDFRPEPFSLHYQRSLFSSMQSLVRETFESINRHISELKEDVQVKAERLLVYRNDILNALKKIYSTKFDTVKTRIHGNFHLRQILLTGKDVSIHDFGGETSRHYSEIRLKRSPINDIANMIRSFYYVAYEGFFSQVPGNEVSSLLPFAGFWAYHMSGIFMRAYLDTAKDNSFLPSSKDDLDILLQTFLLEKALVALNYELNNRPGWVQIPLHMIYAILHLPAEETELLVKKASVS